MIMADKKFGDAGNLVVVEEFLTGIETSILAFVDKNTIVPMESAKDHKKILSLKRDQIQVVWGPSHQVLYIRTT